MAFYVAVTPLKVLASAELISAVGGVMSGGASALEAMVGEPTEGGIRGLCTSPRGSLTVIPSPRGDGVAAFGEVE